MTADKIWETFLTVLGGVITGGIGLFAAWLINKWQRKSERVIEIENRRRDFLAFMASVRAEANRLYATGRFSVFFHDKTPAFYNAVSFIKKDFPTAKQIDFLKLVETVSTYDRGKNEAENQERVLKSIDALVSFAESN